MTRFTNITLLTGLALVSTWASVSDLQAGCGGGGGGYRRPVSYHPRPVYSAPRVYVRPAPRPAPPAPCPTPPAPQPWFDGSQEVAPQPVPQQPAPQQPAPQQPAPQQPAPQQPAPQAAQPETPANAPTENNAQFSALQALAGMTGQASPAPATAPQTPAPQTPEHVGKWTASLPNGSRVQLNLEAQGQFSWTAVTKSGQTSSFQGSYTVENGSLTLIRSTDNQKLAGSITIKGGNAFHFKLADAKDSGLSFVRG